MRVRYLAVAALACTLSLLVMPQSTETAEPQKTVAQVDFDALHAQANAALETLRQSQQRRLALAIDPVF
jgi:hypothetical protein